METQSIFSIAGAIGGIGTLITGASALIGRVWADRMLEADRHQHLLGQRSFASDLDRFSQDRTRRIESLMKHYERQIEEFYGPLFNLIQQVFAANEVKEKILAHDFEANQRECVEDYFQNAYFIPMHDEIKRVMRTKLYLVDGPTVPKSFYRYLTHASQERDQRALWKEYRIDTGFLKGQPWPRELFSDLDRGFRVAMQNYEGCLQGLKDVDGDASGRGVQDA